MNADDADHLGMTDEQWDTFQRLTHGYGEQDANGIDLSLLRANLLLTPTERFDGLLAALDFYEGAENADRPAKTAAHS